MNLNQGLLRYEDCNGLKYALQILGGVVPVVRKVEVRTWACGTADSKLPRLCRRGSSLFVTPPAALESLQVAPLSNHA